MSDKINWLTVVLEDEFCDEGADRIVEAIAMVKGVLSVTPNVASMQDHLAIERVRRELGQKIISVVYPNMIRGE